MDGCETSTTITTTDYEKELCCCSKTHKNVIALPLMLLNKIWLYLNFATQRYVYEFSDASEDCTGTKTLNLMSRNTVQIFSPLVTVKQKIDSNFKIRQWRNYGVVQR